MEKEFDILNRRMEKNQEMRHTYLMFAFTTSIATIAALFIINMNACTTWGCIVPFSVIIPFQARISYSRLTHAKMEAYIRTYYKHQFEFLNRQVRDLRGVMGKIIAIIVNFELSLLAIALDITYIVINGKKINLKIFHDIWFVGIIIATMVTIILAIYTFSYNYFLEKYMKEYEKQRGF